MSRPASLLAPGNWQPSKADSSVRTEDIEVLMRATWEAGRAPAVTVLTNIAGAVSVPLNQASINAGRRLRSMMLPDNPFNPFQSRWRKQSIPSQIEDTTAAEPLLRVEATSERSQSMLSSSGATTSACVTSITRGVRKALQQWAAQKSRRQCMAHWKHGCPQYAPPAHLGHDPNHPSVTHPGSRPTSALTLVRPFSATRKQERASSAEPPRSKADVEVRNVNGKDGNLDRSGEQGDRRPSSAVPRLGEWLHAVRFDDDKKQEEPQTSRAFSASGWEGRITVGSNDRCGHVWGDGIAAGGESLTQSAMPEEDEASSTERGEDNYDDIYEDLDDEDDDELDNRISVMERKFSRLGRERPISAAGRDGISTPFRNKPDVPLEIRVSSALRSPPRRPPRAPQRGSISAAADRRGWARNGVVRDMEEWRPPRVVSSRPTSAPADRSLLGIHRRPDPMAALHARRIKLRMSSADEELRPAGGLQHGASETLHPQQQWQRKQHATRDLTTAVPSWEGDADGGGRPFSSSTAEVAGERYATGGVDEYHRQVTESVAGSRPSSAAFMRWIETRPSARSLVSAISSARTMGLDDPELMHLQVELESRRGGQSDATLARMEDYYSAVVRKTDAPFKSREGPKSYGTPCSARSHKSGLRGTPGSKGSLSSTRKQSAIRGKRKKRPASSRRGRSPSKRRGKAGDDKGAEVSSVPKKVYPSAKAFMVEHFPSEDEQGGSLLGMEQEMECRRAFVALSRLPSLIHGGQTTLSPAGLQHSAFSRQWPNRYYCLPGLLKLHQSADGQQELEFWSRMRLSVEPWSSLQIALWRSASQAFPCRWKGSETNLSPRRRQLISPSSDERSRRVVQQG